MPIGRGAQSEAQAEAQTEEIEKTVIIADLVMGVIASLVAASIYYLWNFTAYLDRLKVAIGHSTTYDPQSPKS